MCEKEVKPKVVSKKGVKCLYILVVDMAYQEREDEFTQRSRAMIWG